MRSGIGIGIGSGIGIGRRGPGAIALAIAIGCGNGLCAQQGVVMRVGDDARVTRFVACWLPEGGPVSVLAPERQKITWRGTLDVALRDRFTFTREGNGAFALEIDGQPVELGKPARLTKGKLSLVATWTPEPKGDAWTRLYWECGEWEREPIAPKFLSYDPNDPALQKAGRVRQGREAFANLLCSKCHEPEHVYEYATSMPELSYTGPSLSDIGSRLELAWMARYVADPAALRPSARMPKVVKDAPEARDVAAFLHSFGGKPADDPRREPGAADAEAGGKRFAALGCVGCHTRPDDPSQQEGRISLRLAGAKFRPSALAQFLKDPTRNHSSTRMPKFALTDAECGQLAAYLQARGAPPLELPAGAPNLERGRKLVISSGCGKCHFGCAELIGPQPPLAQVLPKAASTDCSHAAYALRDDERAALRAFLATDLASLRRDSRAELAERQFHELRCFACHTRDRQQDLWSQLGAELALLAPQGTETAVGAARPHLTWAGEKLRPEYVEKLLLGQAEKRSRPWLSARMPAWPVRAHALAEGLALAHGYAPSAPIDTVTDPQQAAFGKKLVGADGGFTCVQCHAIGAQKATQVFEAEGVDFALAKERLRHDYFTRWVLNPLRIDVSTKMPRYVDKQGKTQLYDGDAKKQIDAIWQFLNGL